MKKSPGSPETSVLFRRPLLRHPDLESDENLQINPLDPAALPRRLDVGLRRGKPAAERNRHPTHPPVVPEPTASGRRPSPRTSTASPARRGRSPPSRASTTTRRQKAPTTACAARPPFSGPRPSTILDPDGPALPRPSARRASGPSAIPARAWYAPRCSAQDVTPTSATSSRTAPRPRGSVTASTPHP